MSSRDIFNLYRQSQQGGELPYFVGKQYGSGWLRTIGRFAFPILRKLGIMAADTAQDVVMNNKSILPTLKEHAMKAVSSVIPGLFGNKSPEKSVNSNGGGVRYKSKKAAKRTINKRGRTHGTIFK